MTATFTVEQLAPVTINGKTFTAERVRNTPTSASVLLTGPRGGVYYLHASGVLIPFTGSRSVLKDRTGKPVRVHLDGDILTHAA